VISLNIKHFMRGNLMNFFVNVPGGLDLEPYNLYHVCVLLVIGIMAALIILFRKKLKDPKLDIKVRIIATFLAFSLEFGYHLSNLFNNTDFVTNLIPLDLCAISLWLAFILCLSKRKGVFEILYFWGIGALISLLYPDITGIGPDKMRFYHYFGVHTFILLSLVYFISVYGYKINFKIFLKAIIILFPITLIVRFIDLSLINGSNPNWMFLVKPPDISTPLDLMPQGGWTYYFSFVLLAVCVFATFYLPWMVYNLIKSKEKTKTGICKNEPTSNQNKILGI